jgi:hypothetical protein
LECATSEPLRDQSRQGSSSPATMLLLPELHHEVLR